MAVKAAGINKLLLFLGMTPLQIITLKLRVTPPQALTRNGGELHYSTGEFWGWLKTLGAVSQGPQGLTGALADLAEALKDQLDADLEALHALEEWLWGERR